MIITISGSAGSGKSTVGKILAKKLGFRHYSIGDMRRKMASERGISIAELNRLGEKTDSTDREPDEYQRELGRKEDNFVIDSRLGFHFIPNSVKVYLDANPETRARRVFSDERNEEKLKSIEDAKKCLVEREKSDKKRYKKYYGVDCYDKSHYDLIIDTSNISAEKVADRIIDFLKNKKML